MNDLMKLIALLSLIRERDARERGEHAAAVAYANAYDWICYAVHDREDCLCNFDGYEEAIKFLEQNPDLDVWDLEEKFNRKEN
jgi:hypothetical protein